AFGGRRGSGDGVFDLIGRDDGLYGAVAFGQTEARAGGHIGRGIGGGHGVPGADDEALGVVEEAGGFGLLDGDANAHVTIGASSGGNGQASAEVLLIPFELGGLSGSEKGADGAALELQHHAAAARSGELHGEN